MIQMSTLIKNRNLTIVSEVALENYGLFNAFDVRVICTPSYHGSDKELMIAVCKVLTEETDGETELKTHYVSYDVHFDSKSRVEMITFQVITPLDPQWYS